MLDTLIDGSDGGPPGLPPAPLPPAGNTIVNSEFDNDLAGWTCDNLGICEWIETDPAFSTTSGAGSVTSPVETFANPGRLKSNCVSVEPGEVVVVDSWLRTTGAMNGVLRARWFASDDCTGAPGTLEIDTVFVPESSQGLSAPAAGAVLAFLARRRAKGKGKGKGKGKRAS